MSAYWRRCPSASCCSPKNTCKSLPGFQAGIQPIAVDVSVFVVAVASCSRWPSIILKRWVQYFWCI